MSFDKDSRNATRFRIHVVLAVAAVFALLVARSVPPQFPKAAFLQHSSIDTLSTISAVSSHNQRPRFDCNGLYWSVPVSEFLPFPPTAKASHLTAALETFPALRTKGQHYNRPPPLGTNPLPFHHS